eukprot:COSAG06_NODE_122_length_23062_cov_43.568990_8_plen_137_part_00
MKQRLEGTPSWCGARTLQEQPYSFLAPFSFSDCQDRLWTHVRNDERERRVCFRRTKHVVQDVSRLYPHSSGARARLVLLLLLRVARACLGKLHRFLKNKGTQLVFAFFLFFGIKLAECPLTFRVPRACLGKLRRVF